VTITALLHRGPRILLVCAALTALAAAPASAQMERPDPAYRGLFGGDGGPPTGHGLDLSASVFVGWDDNVTAGDGGGLGVGDPRFQQSSTYQGASFGLSYRHSWRRVAFGAGASSSLRYYPELGDLTSLNHGASAGISVRLTSRTTWSANQGVAYSPYFQLAFFPGLYLPDLAEPIALDPSLSIFRREAWSYRSSTSLAHRLTRRSTVSADYGYYRTDFREDALPDMAHHYAGARLSYALGRGLSARLGYAYGRAAYARTDDLDARPVGSHIIDAGLDYGGAFALGLSRRTTVSFSTGTTMYDRVDPTTGVRTGLQVGLIGSANLNHRLGRTWNASASYYRGLRFVQGFRQPVFQDSVMARLGGYLGPRTTLAFFTGWANGGFARTVTEARGGGYDTVVAGSTLQYALTRNLAVYGQYLHYRYRFDERVALPEGLSSRLQRNSVQGGLSFWLPLLR
jgi:hypothetical protein